ncbi:hypothetical protein RND71_025329 [Anisodus tanguticus]|uniref:ArsA/GET3 Anion-transporting ATPase-like domain-containing protein n=1 Tax=Anisodus tanguticus TaxID=243964 RepID=A0AAE1RSU3_9SOLA|nr:hypothetical protein RND71_025329 [Anisodus tanguticus]
MDRGFWGISVWDDGLVVSEVEGVGGGVGREGGVGKTSCAASLAVKFANNGHPTLVVSTDPAHSLSDSFDQDLTGGALVPVQGVDSPLYAHEINPEKTREEFHATSQLHGGSDVKDFMGSMGLGMLVDQVMQFLESKDYSTFSRIGHTLRLLSLPDFLDASIGKMMNTEKLEQLRERMAKVRDLFRDSETTEFIIVTIPTDQMRSLDMISKDPELASLKIIQAPLVDVEIRGVAGLKFMGDMVWK